LPRVLPRTPPQRADEDIIAMQRQIIGFHQDAAGDWVAEFDCGHCQHVRHDPPWSNRPWTQTTEGRAAVIGRALPCRPCDTGAPPAPPHRPGST